jgi:Pvc16 N-terminal domain
MSNALAIATVTQTLINRITVALGGSLVNGAQVSAMRPDDASLQQAENTPRVNIFLYQVTPNLAFRNADLPTRRPDGTLIQRPQLALDLHYLFTFYGNDANLEHQRLLGAVARYLHAFPALNRTDIEAVELMKDATNNDALYLASDLSEQSELVRFTPVKFTLDDISKLWAAFPTVDFVLSAVYSASVVLIQTDDVPPGPALPVLKRHVRAIPFNLSNITSVSPQSITLSSSSSTIISLLGQGLSVDNQVAFLTPGNSKPIPAAVGVGATPQLVPVTLPGGLHAGINSVQLMQVDLSPPGSPPAPSLLSSSNSFPFLISPTIVALMPGANSITAKVYPTVGSGQSVSLVLNQVGGTVAYTLDAPPHPAETDTFTFSTVYPNPQAGSGATLTVPAGAYLARIKVDAADSPLTVDSSGTFSGPTVAV